MIAADTTQRDVHNGRHRWRRRIDLQDAGRVCSRAGQVGAVARRIADRCAVQVEGVTARSLVSSPAPTV